MGRGLRWSGRIAGAAALAAVSLALGCAAPGRPVTQTVTVETPGCSNASCILSNDLGSWEIRSTPGSATLTTSQQPLRVLCRSGDGPEDEVGRHSSLPPLTSQGALVGGVLGGVGIGAAVGTTALMFIPQLGALVLLSGVAVGAATGQAIESQGRANLYPEVITVPMQCASAVLAAPGATGASGASAVPGVPARPDAIATPSASAAAAPSAPPVAPAPPVAIAPPAPAVAAAPPVAPTAALGLGLRGLAASEAKAAGLGDRPAVLVVRVDAGGLAAAADLRVGDIVLAADGRPTLDAAQLESRIRATPRGTTLRLQVRRGERDLDVILSLPPERS